MMERQWNLVCEGTRLVFVPQSWQAGDIGLIYVPHALATGPPGWTAADAGYGSLFARRLDGTEAEAATAAHTPEPFDHEQAWATILPGGI